MRTAATRPRRLWPFILIGLVIVGAIIAALTVYGPWRSSEPAATPTGTPEPTATSVEDIEPTGCLGGSDRDAAMVLAAQEEAPRTDAGAVDFAASFVRWLQRYPYPSPDEAAEVGNAALASDSFTSDLPEYLAAEPDLTGGIVAPDTEYNMNTVPGVWFIEPENADETVVTIGSGFVVEGSLSPSLRSSITISLVWSDDGWTVSGAEGTRTVADLYEIGTTFTGGC